MGVSFFRGYAYPLPVGDSPVIGFIICFARYFIIATATLLTGGVYLVTSRARGSDDPSYSYFFAVHK